jgi:hypothetical protein
VLDEVVNTYDYPKEIETPVPELIGLSDQQPTKGILTIEQMAKFVKAHQADPLFRLHGKHRTHLAIKDLELQIIDSLIDDRIINKLLAPEGYTPASRDFFPHNMLRTELLKAIKYPEIS